MFVVVLSSTIIRESQIAALEVSPAASVEMTRHTVDRVYTWYGYSLVNFFVSAVLLIWLFIGMPKWVGVSLESLLPPYDLDQNGALNATERAAASVEDKLLELILTRENDLVVQCLDPYSDQQKTSQKHQGFVLASLNTTVFCFMIVRGASHFSQIRQDFERRHLLEWFHVRRQQQEADAARVELLGQPADGPFAQVPPAVATGACSPRASPAAPGMTFPAAAAAGGPPQVGGNGRHAQKPHTGVGGDVDEADDESIDSTG